MEQVRDGVQIVGVVVVVGVLHVHGIFLQLDEEQGDAVHEANDVGAAAVEVAVDLQFLDGEEMFVFRVLEVDDGRLFRFGFAVRAFDRYRDAVSDQEILLLVDLQKRGGGEPAFQRSLRFAPLGFGDPRVEPGEGGVKIPSKQDFPV